MDNLLKQDGLDLCLKTYPLIPFTKNDGVLACVPGALTLTEIKEKYPERGIRAFVQAASKGDQALFNARMGNFAASCAG